MVREIKNSRATTKNFLLRFFRKHAPQSEHFRLVFYTPALAPFLFSVRFSQNCSERWMLYIRFPRK
ncbi:DUF1661 domain-containing protein [Porphyromonas gingivalis]|uniref:DUF1661 domain-containing protein n=1 Tax=Porphyromonas gingivalis TaxID=837 RepID=UPI0012BC9F5D|nr:DUF1661 domain-containing protein [Porphyromonas gingivalis]